MNVSLALLDFQKNLFLQSENLTNFGIRFLILIFFDLSKPDCPITPHPEVMGRCRFDRKNFYLTHTYSSQFLSICIDNKFANPLFEFFLLRQFLQIHFHSPSPIERSDCGDVDAFAFDVVAAQIFIHCQEVL